MKKKIIWSMTMIALVSIVFSMVLSGVVSYYDSLEIIKNSTMVESEYIRSGIEQQADYLRRLRHGRAVGARHTRRGGRLRVV